MLCHQKHKSTTSSSSCGFCRLRSSIPQRALLLAFIMAAVCRVHNMSPSFAVCALSVGGSTHHRPTVRTSLHMAPSRLNYKDNDDDDFVTNTVIDQPKFRRRVLSAVGSVVRSPGRRLKKRRSLSKFIFPPDEPDDSSEVGDISKKLTSAVLINDEHEDDALLVDENETYLSLTKAKGRRVIGRKKKTPLVTVKNIHELREAVLDRGLNLRDVDLEYSVPECLLTSQKGHSDKMILGEDGALDSKDEPNSDEWQLIGNLLAEDAPTAAEEATANKKGEELFSHDVLNLLHKRYHSKSTPGSRAPDDTDILALSIEGGGMRGAVSGGMAAAIACLGLSNAFDSIYGSSAGSIIGSYFVSRQLYLDVYTDVIPAGKDLFVKKSKIISDIFRNMFVAHVVKGSLGKLGKKLNSNLVERYRSPIMENNSTLPVMQDLPTTRAGGLNTSFVLDAIMCPERGLRPLDLETFAHNDAVQPLRIVSSAVDLETGELKSVCFGSKEGHFRDEFANPAAHAVSGDPKSSYPEIQSAQADENGYRRGIWACLGASMTVPGAAGNPFRMDLSSGEKLLCFDAFCYEPVPFRSAVAEGATHVLALRSRPASYVPKTKPTLYERAVAPFYFRSSGVNTPAEFFEKGGQQYLYAEDVLTCDDGLASSEAIPIPPAKVLYAAPEENRVSADDKKRENWRRAHLLPITVPADVPELSVLSQDRDDIIAGMREGFAAAYEALAPVVGLEASGNGMLVAELVFPDGDAPTQDAGVQVLPGEKLITNVVNHDVEEKAKEPSIGLRNRISKRFRRFRDKDHSTSIEEVSAVGESDNTFSSLLPGLQSGSLPMVWERVQTYLERNTSLSLK